MGGINNAINNTGNILFELASKSVLTYIFTQLPILNNFILKQAVTFFVNKVLHVLIDKTEFGVYMLYVIDKTKRESAEFQAAAKTNEEIQANGTDEEKRIAREKLIEAARNFIRLRQP